MAELSQIKIGGVLYNIKDATARENTGIELDTEMNETSTNGVQNCVIKAYVDNQITTEVENQIEIQLQDSIQETVNKAVDEKLSNDSSDEDINDEIDSWF